MSTPRIDALTRLARDKGELALTWEQLTRLDTLLLSFGVAQLDDGVDWWAQVRARCGARIYARCEELEQARGEYQRRDRQVPAALELALYELAAEEPLAGLLHSQRRPLILDAGALLARVAELAEVRGGAVEIGCSSGYLARWLVPGLTSVSGFDFSQATIAAARSRSAPAQLSFHVGSLDDAKALGPVDLVYAIDGGLNIDDRVAMRAAAALLGDGGVLVTAQATPRDWRRSLARCRDDGLGLVYSDIVGGWNGLEIYCEPAFVFVKGAAVPLPRDPRATATDAWTGFSAYAGGASPATKNQAFCRTTAKHGPRPLT